MPNLFTKLNVLIQSTVRGALGAERSGERPLNLADPNLGRELDEEIAGLRSRIEHAIDEDDRAQAELTQLRREIDRWDLQADRALQASDDAAARDAVRQMQLAQHQLSLHAAELSQHRYATSELIRHVNELEAVAAEIRQRQGSATGSAEVAPWVAQWRRLREHAWPAPSAPQEAEPAALDELAIDDNLAARRSRLSQ